MKRIRSAERSLTDRPVRFGTDIGNDIDLARSSVTKRAPAHRSGIQRVAKPDRVVRSTDCAAGLQRLGGTSRMDRSIGTIRPLQRTSIPATPYSVHVAKGRTAQRTTIISITRVSNPVVLLTWLCHALVERLVVGAPAAQGTSTNLLFDDIYLSKTATIRPARAFGFTVPVSASPSGLSIKAVAGGDLEITFGGGTLESTTALPGGWTAVPNATASPYKTKPDAVARFYRVRQ